MTFILGVLLFALGITISIALHEFGHLLTAKAFGMKARRYFIGFGPRIWSFRKGETEYGLKAIPLGGFCDIAGMTALDEVSEDEKPRAFYRKPVWQRVIVLGAGSVTHFLVGILVVYVMAVSTGLPDARPAVGAIADCVSDQNPTTGQIEACPSGAPEAPAKVAGLNTGDVILSVGGTTTENWDQVLTAIRGADGPTEFVVERAGERRTVTVDVQTVQRLPVGAEPGEDATLEPAGVVGMGQGVGPNLEYGVLAAVPHTFDFTGTMFAATWEGLKRFPEKVPAVVRAIGGEDDPERPISVVGASIIGGDAAERGLWELFLFMLAAVNFFVGVFNLLPLLPLDGGHIAVNLYEKVRDWVRRLRGLAPGGPVDYTKLLPLTYVAVLIGGGIMLLTITADIVNPIRIQ
ncbi:MAG TPA: site-2 protease family protein [Pseudonocardiaceae bacterium]